jgi:hypothetical protein
MLEGMPHGRSHIIIRYLLEGKNALKILQDLLKMSY